MDTQKLKQKRSNQYRNVYIGILLNQISLGLWLNSIYTATRNTYGVSISVWGSLIIIYELSNATKLGATLRENGEEITRATHNQNKIIKTVCLISLIALIGYGYYVSNHMPILTLLS